MIKNKITEPEMFAIRQRVLALAASMHIMAEELWYLMAIKYLDTRKAEDDTEAETLRKG